MFVNSRSTFCHMLKRVMPQDLIDKFHLVKIPAPPDLSPEEKKEYDSIEAYHFPMPGHEVNCWFQVFSHTKITNPTMMIFSVREEQIAISVPVQALYEKTQLEMYAYIKEECKRAHADNKRRTELN